MPRTLVAALALLGGCGFSLPIGTTYVPPSGQPLPQLSSAVPASTPTYRIDGQVGANVPLDSYGITTNGLTWYLEWQTDQAAHKFTGDIYCPVGCTLANISYGSQFPGDIRTSPEPNHLRFEVQTAAGVHEHLEFDALRQPLTFFLYINGLAATSPRTAFLSSGQLATTASMPFNLISSNVKPIMLSAP